MRHVKRLLLGLVAIALVVAATVLFCYFIKYVALTVAAALILTVAYAWGCVIHAALVERWLRIRTKTRDR